MEDPLTETNISTKIAEEEHFIAPEDLQKDSNAIYIEDNPTKALEKLLSLSNNTNFEEKVQYVKHFADLLEMIGWEGIEKLKDIISFILDDTNDIKQAFLTQVPFLISLLQKQGEKGYQQIVDVLLPTISNLMTSTTYEIKEQAGSELGRIAPLLSEDDRTQHLLPSVLSMAHDDENEENRIIAVKLLSQIASLIGKDLCEQFLALQLLSMGEDPKVSVRREVIANLPLIGKIVSPMFFHQRILSFYLNVCKESYWELRKACIDIIYEICNLCIGDISKTKEKELTNITLKLLKDSNKFVKAAAYKNLGLFISTLQGLEVNEKLLAHYLQMTDASVNGLTFDNEIMFACAYNFPAVLLTLGSSKWPQLLKLFNTLLKADPKIRKPLACSLHHIAKIIGEEDAEKHLLPALESFLEDSNDDIKYGVLENLALFFKVFKAGKREDMIDILINLQKDQKKWRVRELIAKQIENFTLLFPPEVNFTIISPIIFKLVDDPVACVRVEAAKKIYGLLKSLYGSEAAYKASIIEHIKGFSVSNRYPTRQAYILMCDKIMKDEEIFKAHFLESFLELASDKVSNVRVSVAKTLLHLYQEKRKLCGDPQIVTLIKKMKDDQSRDVRSIIDSIYENYISKLFDKVNTQDGLDELNKMGFSQIITKKAKEFNDLTIQQDYLNSKDQADQSNSSLGF